MDDDGGDDEGELRCAFDTGRLLEDHVAVAEDRWRLILNSDAYFFPAP